MVLLTDIITLQQCFNTITTGIPSLDRIFLNQVSGIKNKVYDFQSAPTCNAMYIVICSMIISHLKNNQPVVIIDTLNKFPTHFITSHPDFELKWVESRLFVSYTCDTFARLYALFLFNNKNQVIPKNSLVIVNDFHELMELSKLELSSAHEELVLKHHIETNMTLIANKTNEPVALPQLPPSSDLLRGSPIAKFQTQLESLFNLFNQVCINQNLMIFTFGHLDTKYQPFRMKSHPLDSSSQLTYTPPEKGRVVLSPFTYTKQVLATRVMFYFDWYHNTPHFWEAAPTNGAQHLSINQAQLKLVFAAKVEHGRSSYPPVYFDVDDEFYHEEDNAIKKYDMHSLIDLSRVANRRMESQLISSSPAICDTTVIDVSVNEESFLT